MTLWNPTIMPKLRLTCIFYLPSWPCILLLYKKKLFRRRHVFTRNLIVTFLAAFIYGKKAIINSWPCQPEREREREREKKTEYILELARAIKIARVSHTHE